MNKELINKGKKLSFLLRHDKDYKFDEHGYRDVNDIIDNHDLSFDEINEIVETNDKKRYEFNQDKTKIRARQGHSININVDLKEEIPTKILYHGTSDRFVNQILKDGIKKMNRNHVHLSNDIDTAINVGKRHGKPVVFEIDTRQMINDGIKFYLSNNNVWLTDYIHPKYIKLI